MEEKPDKRRRPARKVSPDEWKRREEAVKRFIAGEGSLATMAEELDVSRQGFNNWVKRFQEEGELAPRTRGRPKLQPPSKDELDRVRTAIAEFRRERGIKFGQRMKKSDRPTLSEMQALVSEALGKKVSHSRAEKMANLLGVLVRPDPVAAPGPDDGALPDEEPALDPWGDDDDIDDIVVPVSMEEYKAAVEETRAEMARSKVLGKGDPLRVGHGVRVGKHRKSSQSRKKKRKKRK